MRASLTQVRSVRLPKAVADETQAHLRAAGRRGLEGMALWVGTHDGASFSVREVIIPEQKGTRGDHGLMVSVPGFELQRINLQLYKSGLRLLAQIHSHPTEAYHSAMDDEYAIATALGAFSLVVPDFAREAFSISRCATYRLTPSPWWKPGNRPYWAKVPARQATTIISIME